MEFRFLDFFQEGPNSFEYDLINYLFTITTTCGVENRMEGMPIYRTRDGINGII